MSAIKEAFHAAGVKSPSEQLEDIALKAMVEHASDTDATVEAIWAVVKKRPALMISLFALEYQRAIRALIYRVRNSISYKESRGDLTRPIERRGAVIVSLLRDQDERREAVRQAAARVAQDMADAEYQTYLASWKKTPIGGLTIGGAHVWEVSARTVRSWLPTERRRWRCVELLIEGLPDDGRPIGYYRRPEDVEALWNLAGDAE